MTTDLLTVFLISMAGAWFGQSVPGIRRTPWGTRQPNLIGFAVPAVVMILYSGLRSTIGDTVYYIHTYDNVEANGMARPTFGDKAYLFEMLRYFLHQNDATSGTLIMITALITLVPIFLMLYKYSCDYKAAIFFFFTTGLYAASMNGIRQFVATGILMIGTKYLFSHKKSDVIKFLVLIAIAYMVHSSALIMIPICFLCRQKAWSAPTFIILGGGIVSLVFVSQFMPSFLGLVEDSSYSTYTDVGWFTEGIERGASILRVAFQCMPMVLSMIYSKQIRRNGPVADILINLSVFHAAIYILALYNWIFARFAFYTFPFMILLLSLIATTVLKRGKNKGLYLILVVCYLIFFIKDSYSNYMNWYASKYFDYNNNLWFSFMK